MASSRIGPDYATGKPVRIDEPEEKVRQDYERILVEDYGYRKDQLDIRVPIRRGSQVSDEADIAIYRDKTGRDQARDILGLVETKSPTEQTGQDQLKSYMTATSATWAVWTNGPAIEYFCKPPGQAAVLDGVLNNIPVRGQSLEDVGKLTREDLKPYSAASLKIVFRRILNTLYANTNISRREKLGNEMIKLIFAKIRDEQTYPNRPPSFRVGFNERPEEVKKRIVTLFKAVVSELSDDEVFDPHETITLDAKGVAWVVGQLERGSLTDTHTDVVGDAFEVFAESKLVGEKGEFFTPRNVIDVAVKLIAPKPEETVCDPACGSGGFLISAMRHVWSEMADSAQWRGLRSDLFDEAKRKMARRCFFGIDKETDLVRIAKAYMAISGDGRSNIVHDNSLHNAKAFQPRSARHFVIDGDRFRQFDCILTNPPYGKQTKVLKTDAADFDLGHSWRWAGDEWKKGQPRDQNPYVLFVERCFDMLRDGGRLAIVLPEIVFHGTSCARLRDYIAEHGRVCAVVDLPHNTFRPYCNAKTCLLVVKKGEQAGATDTVIMAEAVQMGHDHQGRELHRSGTEEVWDDLPLVAEELDNPGSPDNRFVRTVSWAEMDQAGHWVPRYWTNPPEAEPPAGSYWVSLGELKDEGILRTRNGHGSPPSAAKGSGSIPYFRTSDVVNWELYRNPTALVGREVFEAVTRNKQLLRGGEVLFVRRGSYRLGTVAMASKKDRESIVMSELLILEVEQPNRFELTPFHLLGYLSLEPVQAQIHRLDFVDTTLPNLGERWRELRLPIHRDEQERHDFGVSIEGPMRKKWEAQQGIDALRDALGGNIVT